MSEAADNLAAALRSEEADGQVREIVAAPRKARRSGTSVISRLVAGLSPKKISIVYIAALCAVAFAIWIPGLFFSPTTLRALLYNQAVTGVVALAFLIPYTTLNFDLTVGSMVGVSSLGTCWLIVNEGIPVPVALVVSLIFCGAIGAVTATLVTIFKIDSIITTISMMFIINALGGAALGGRQVFGMPRSYLDIAAFKIAGIAMPFFYLMLIGLIAWYVLTHTPPGRHLYAIGGGREAARLAGVNVNRLIFGSFIASAVLAGVAGIIVSSRVATGDYTVGSPYLFPAAAAIFLGSTQVKPKVFNVWGTILAVYALGFIVEGLELGGAPYWMSDLMNGLALLTAVAVSDTKFGRRSFLGSAK
jgi:ribose transport system permease protein